MAATANTYTSGLSKCADGTIALLTDTMKLLLVASAYTPNRDHDFVSDLTEISGASGYTGGFAGSGRKTLTSKTITVDDTNDRWAFDAADVAFGALGAGATIGGSVMTKEITNDAASPIVAFCGCTDTATDGNTVTFQFDAGGLFRVTSA